MTASSGAIRESRGPRQGQGAGVSAIGLHLPRARRAHGGEVRVGDDDLVPQRLETPRAPFAVGRGLDHDPRPGPMAEHGGEALNDSQGLTRTHESELADLRKRVEASGVRS